LPGARVFRGVPMDNHHRPITIAIEPPHNITRACPCPLPPASCPQVLQVLDGPPGGGGGGGARADSPAPSFGSLVHGEPLRVRLVQLATLMLRVRQGPRLLGWECLQAVGQGAGGRRPPGEGPGSRVAVPPPPRPPQLAPDLVTSDEQYKKRLITWFWRLLKAFPEVRPRRRRDGRTRTVLRMRQGISCMRQGIACTRQGIACMHLGSAPEAAPSRACRRTGAGPSRRHRTRRPL
jgi:hypothetical protein